MLLLALAPAVPWALGFAPVGRLPFAGDLSGDGRADLICVSPKGDAFVDTALTGDGKCLVPQRSRSNWGKDLLAAAVGEFDSTKGVDVLATSDGQTLTLLSGYQGHEFKTSVEWVKLPTVVPVPHMVFSGGRLHVWAEKSGKGFSVDPVSRAVKDEAYPPGVKWMAWEGGHMFACKVNGEAWHDGKRVGIMKSGLPVLAGNFFVDQVDKGAPANVLALPQSGSPADWCAADIDKDGDLDLIETRYSDALHGHATFLHRTVSPGETDSDSDGLSNAEEAKLGTDPLNPDTDNDSLVDSWEVGTYRDLDFKALGCNPRKVDLICLISPFEQMKEDHMKSQFAEITRYYAEVEATNPDGSKGWAFHPVFLEKVKEEDQKKPWWELRDKFRPGKWKGIVHWMQITPWGGGQADQLGDGGGCGGGGWALYATFIHEFGHQLGLPHEGFYGAAWCPTYFSLMNYAYSYTFEDDIKKVRYSDGRLSEFTMKETDLSEVLPLPYEKIKFLEKAPYRYRLKQNGPTTLIDWNWNGVFGEQHIRADINYSYSTTAGRRDEVDKLQSAPWLFTHHGSAYALFARHTYPADVKTDPTVSPDKPGALYVRRLIEPYKWEDAKLIEAGGVTGDPVAISYKGRVLFAYPTRAGVVARWWDGRSMSEPIILEAEGSRAPSVGVFRDRLLVATWNPADLKSSYRWWDGKAFGKPQQFNFLSRVPLGFAEDTLKGQLIVGLTQDQDKDRPSRWQIRRYTMSGDSLMERQKEWIE
ncbi:MAG TPA: hypothetical protein VK968_06135, partial [Roseimicrobium sp.]|nr:hypothetical protein [Roseimicrobium sp.]